MRLSRPRVFGEKFPFPRAGWLVVAVVWKVDGGDVFEEDCVQ